MVCSTRCAARGVFTALLPYLWFSQKHAPSHELLQVRSEALKSSLTEVSERNAAPPSQAFPCRSPSAFSRCAGITHPRVEGMTPQAVRRKVRHEKFKHATRLQPPFPAAVQDDGTIEISTLR